MKVRQLVQLLKPPIPMDHTYLRRGDKSSQIEHDESAQHEEHGQNLLQGQFLTEECDGQSQRHERIHRNEGGQHPRIRAGPQQPAEDDDTDHVGQNAADAPDDTGSIITG